MKIDILSDIHIDMWHNASTQMSDNKYKSLFSSALPQEPGKVLVIAGDLGHYHTQNIDLLKRFQDQYGYKIIYVWGNHDFYRVSKKQYKQYKDSIVKVQELRDLINEQEGMYHLDGEVIEIEGVKFGGCNGWYDESLFDGTREEVNQYWKEWMNDSKIVLSDKEKELEFDTLHKLDLPKIEAVHQKCDVMITHVCPVADKSIFETLYNEFHPVRTFYCFDGSKYLQHGSMQYWIFGHTHRTFDKEYYGKRLVCNTLGRPSRGNHIPEAVTKQIVI